jgi:hypothetical protein
MIRSFWTIVCKSAIIDRITNNVTLSEVIEQIGLAAAPVFSEGIDAVMLPIQLAVVTFWEWDGDGDASGQVHIQLTDPTGRPLNAELPQPIAFSPESIRARTIVGSAWPYTVPGRYLVEAQFRSNDEDKWRTSSAHPVFVHIGPILGTPP